MENTFGRFLKEKRQEKNLTQKELAKMLYVSESTISKWEKDIAHPDITMVSKLSEIFDVTEHELITASVDVKSKKEKADAKKWRTLSFSWSLFFYIAYIITLIPCFICNISINKTLSWFWIVFFALLLSFTFTNLPKLIKKHKLIFVPLSILSSLSLLLATCAIYTSGNWFFVAFSSILFAFIIVFTPIYISKYKIFSQIKKHNDFISFAIYFIALNLLLIVIDLFTIINNYCSSHWYLTIALPIVFIVYLILNLFLSIKFLKINKLLKVSLILCLINFFAYIVPLFIKTENTTLNYEIQSLNIFKANFSNWHSALILERNINCIIFLTILTISISFLIAGLILCIKRKNKFAKHKKDTL